MSRDSDSSGIRIRPAGLNTTRRRRTLDERAFVRFPALYRGFASWWSRLPPRSRLRRLILLRITAQATSAANRRDFDVLLTGFDPQIDFRIVGGPWGMVIPDLIGHHHGHAGYREVWREVLEAFEDWTLEPEELIDLGHRLIGVTRMSGHGTVSGVPVSLSVFRSTPSGVGWWSNRRTSGTVSRPSKPPGRGVGVAANAAMFCQRGRSPPLLGALKA